MSDTLVKFIGGITVMCAGLALVVSNHVDVGVALTVAGAAELGVKAAASGTP